MNRMDFRQEAIAAVIAEAKIRYGEDYTEQDIDMFYFGSAMGTQKAMAIDNGATDRVYKIVKEKGGTCSVTVYVPAVD